MQLKIMIGCQSRKRLYSGHLVLITTISFFNTNTRDERQHIQFLSDNIWNRAAIFWWFRATLFSTPKMGPRPSIAECWGHICVAQRLGLKWTHLSVNGIRTDYPLPLLASLKCMGYFLQPQKNPQEVFFSFNKHKFVWNAGQPWCNKSVLLNSVNFEQFWLCFLQFVLFALKKTSCLFYICADSLDPLQLKNKVTKLASFCSVGARKAALKLNAPRGSWSEQASECSMCFPSLFNRLGNFASTHGCHRSAKKI